MFIERLITFSVLGYFVFVADVDHFWNSQYPAGWYSGYIPWLGLIMITIIACRRPREQPSRMDHDQ